MIRAIKLQTAYLCNPVGIDISKPMLSWLVCGAKKQTAYEIRVAINNGSYVSFEPVETDHMRTVFPIMLQSRDTVKWQVRLTDETGTVGEWSDEASFEMGLLDKSDWQATWIMGNYDHDKNKKVRYPVDCFQKRFDAPKDTVKARLYITACGIYEARLNGEKVGEQVLMPGSTAFQKRVHYQVYDVTAMLRPQNELCVDLADGFYTSKTGVFDQIKVFGHEPKFLAQLEITDAAGNVQVISSDETFRWSNDGPVRFADMKDGESVDANCVPTYASVARVTDYAGIVCCSNNVPIREKERFTNPKILRCPDGHTVLDFGQNIAGYMQAKIAGTKGHKCAMVFGEKLDENGNFTYKNINSKEYTDSHFQTVDFTCSGKQEVYKPRFTVMGFQYVLLRGWPEEVKPENFAAIAVYSDMPKTFSFTSSHADINQIVENTLWSVKDNFLDVPTDCPTRERAGWTGDAQLFFNTGAFMMDQRAFFRKWMRDVADCQKENGMVYNVNPGNPSGSALYEWVSMEGASGWGHAMILIPYYYWKRYGDDTLIRQLWNNMEQCFRFYHNRMGKRNIMSLFNPKRSSYDKYLSACGRDFGEWTEPKDCAPSVLSLVVPAPEEATAYHSYSSRLMAEMANYLGKDSAGFYEEIADKTEEAYNFYFVQNGNMESNRMCKYVRPCALGLAKGEARQKLMQKMVELNRQRDYKIGTGFLTTPFVLTLLTEAGAGDEAFKMLTNPEFGWVQQIRAGATTIWENWTPNASLNHYSKGACCQWLFDCLCGIQLDGRENHFIVEPHTISQLDHISMTYDSVYGSITSGWKRTEHGYEFQITIPANCTAEIRVPGMESQSVGTGEYAFVQKKGKCVS